MKAQLNIRVSDLTRHQLAELGRLWGTTQSETLSIIVDRAYQQQGKEAQDGPQGRLAEGQAAERGVT